MYISERIELSHTGPLQAFFNICLAFLVLLPLVYGSLALVRFADNIGFIDTESNDYD